MDTESFVTSRDELWAALVTELPHGYIVEPGEHGDGRAYYILNRDLFPAFRAFCDRKEADKGRPAPDYNPRVDHPERYSDGPY